MMYFFEQLMDFKLLFQSYLTFNKCIVYPVLSHNLILEKQSIFTFCLPENNYKFV